MTQKWLQTKLGKFIFAWNCEFFHNAYPFLTKTSTYRELGKGTIFSFDTEVSESLVIELIYYEANKNEDNYSVL